MRSRRSSQPRIRPRWMPIPARSSVNQAASLDPAAYGMSDELVLTIPGSPYRHTAQTTRRATSKAGRVFMYTDKAAKRAEADLAARFRAQLPDGWTPRTDPCEAVVLFTFPYRKKDRADGLLHPMATRPDGDDLAKAILDLLAVKRDGTGAEVFDDDARVFRLTVEKWRGPDPSLSVRLRWPFAPGSAPVQQALPLPGV